MDKTKIIIISSLVAAAILVLIIVFGFVFKATDNSPESVSATLQFWGVNDNEAAYQSAISGFKSLYPNIEIQYRRFNDIETYERSLLNAFAENRAPDVFMVRNNDLFRKMNIIRTAPTSAYSIIQMRNDFPSVVEENFAFDGNIYGLPLSIDTLVTIYNEDIFNENSIVFPPANWNDLQNYAPTLTKKNQDGEITQSAAAMGGSENVQTSKDILSILMLQTGVEIINNSYTSTNFDTSNGSSALNFYTSFANPDSNNYTWNKDMKNSRQAFADEKVAMIFDYQSAIKEIKSRNPFVNLEVAPLPQSIGSDRKMSFTNYWGYTVSTQSNYFNVAWDFVKFMTVDTISAQDYMITTGKVPALRILINANLESADLEVFAKQTLLARSWPEPHPELVKDAFNNMIDDVVDKGYTPREATKRARDIINNLMQTR
ncbi:MAG: extracellular solute-binding protein [Candidatus Paceibacterota bacterium]